MRKVRRIRTLFSSTFILPALLQVILLSCISERASAQVEAPAPGTSTSFQNPVLWEDLADLDIIRVGDTYYYSASNMHYSPGAPILESKDLVNWEYVGHSVPVLDFGPAYDLNGGSAYVRGTWASFLNYRKSNKTFYWGGCIDFSKTYIYAAPSAAGPWRRRAVLDRCYYDAGLLIDDDDKLYVAYGNTTLSVAQLSADGTSEVTARTVFSAPPSIGPLEGSRFYKIHGNYYIFADHPPNGEYVLKSTSGPFGPYTLQPLVVNAISPIPGAGSPHQGGIVQNPSGDWFYLGFVDAYPGGRVPVLAPIKWNADGWPVLQLDGNQWNISYPYPSAPHPLRPATGVEAFEGTALGQEWEWNHNPDNSKWSLEHGLSLKTATITNDLYMARNTLTHRILGPKSTATIALDYSRMKEGDHAGLALLRNSSSWIGIERTDRSFKVAMKSGLTMDRTWKTTAVGTELASVPVTGGRIWLRVSADVRPGPGRTATYSYSTDGENFIALGTPFVLNSDWMFFMGYRYAIFNYATQSLGGEVRVSSFNLTAP